MTDDLEQTTIKPADPYEPVPPTEPNVLTSQVQAPPAAAPAAGRSRWLIAAGAIGVVVILSALAVSLLTGRAPNAVVLGYVPADSILYGEARLDLPGDQRAAVGEFLSRFPGFADQAAMETKIDEVLDRLVSGATDGRQAFSSDIKPWFGGQVAFSVGALPDPSGISESDVSAMAGTRFLVLVSIKDEALARSWFDGVIAENGVSTSTETYGGASLNVFSEEGTQAAYALLDGKVAVLGDLESVRAAVDTKGAGAFGTGPNVTAALDATSGDHVGFVYMAVRPWVEWSSRVGADMPGALGSTLTDLVPDWAAFSARVQGDALVFETLAPVTDGTEAPAARTSTIVDHVPAGTILLTVSHDYGKGLTEMLETWRADPAMKPIVDGLDQAVGMLGGTSAAIGWIGDTAVTVNRTADGIEGGLVIVPTDRAAADRLFTSLKTLISLGGATMGVTVREEDHAGTPITIIDFGELSDLAGLAGTSPEMFGTSLPSGRVELAYAITDQLVVLGSGPGFVGRILDTTPETSLGGTERYKALAARAGTGAGVAFVDVTAMRELLERAMAGAAAERTQYEQEVKPFFEPFDALIGSTSVKDGISRSTIILTAN